MDRDVVMYATAMAVLGVLTLMLGFQPALAGGYVGTQLDHSNYGLNYQLTLNPSHVEVSIEDLGFNDFAIEHFTEHVLETYWNYVTIENPEYSGYLEIISYANLGKHVRPKYFIHAESHDARRLPLDQFIDTALQGYHVPSSPEEPVSIGDEEAWLSPA